MSADKVYPITFVTETSHRELAEAISTAIHDHDEILQFVLTLDLVVADYDFTKDLRDRLSEALAVEDAAADPSTFEPSEGEWVQGWDDREQGTVEGKFSRHLDGTRSVIQQPVRGDSRVYELDVLRATLKSAAPTW